MQISVRDLQALKLNMLSATPVLNRPVDLERALHLMARKDWPPALDFSETNPAGVEAYEDAQKALVDHDIPSEELEQYLFLLDPSAFSSLATIHGMTDHSISALIAASVILPIWPLIQLKRTAAFQLEEGSRIGDRYPSRLYIGPVPLFLRRA